LEEVKTCHGEDLEKQNRETNQTDLPPPELREGLYTTWA
jgi:hypothetical protein